jgi:hypothetical protein
MKKTMTVMGIAALALLFVGFAVASPMWQRDAGLNEIVEDGTFEQLQEYRETSGRPVMSWVDSAEDFALMQEHHSEMEAWREENGITAGRGMMGGGTRGSGFGGCPMHS